MGFHCASVRLKARPCHVMLAVTACFGHCGPAVSEAKPTRLGALRNEPSL